MRQGSCQSRIPSRIALILTIQYFAMIGLRFALDFIHGIYLDQLGID
jgi:hypothetical protein